MSLLFFISGGMKCWADKYIATGTKNLWNIYVVVSLIAKAVGRNGGMDGSRFKVGEQPAGIFQIPAA